MFWLDPKKHVESSMTSSSVNQNKTMDVLIAAHNYRQLPFSIEIEKAIMKLPFHCEND